MMLCGGEQNDAADFRETKGGFHVERGENGFNGNCVRRKIANQLADHGVNGFESGAGGFLADFVRNAKSAVMEHAAIAAVGFNDAVASWTGSGRIDAEDAKAARIV